ncbi:MAG TPA: glycosyltransferase [Candidatus Limnocylindria bacterium]|nr:glycosyltransferase [Candidatus Limnocylindria bacterium]
MKISIVVPAFNEEKLLGTSLRSIKAAAEAFHARGWETELVVCDNNSSDRTAEVARVEGARVVFEPVNQIGRARNAGAAAATGDWLVFVDADSYPSRELFADTADAMSSGKFIGGGVTVKLDEFFPGMSFFTWVWNWTSRIRKWCAGSFIFCETKAFREIGGFSSEFFVSEELDLSKRLSALGKSRGRPLTILHRHPLVTSARKMRLYKYRDYLRLLFKMFLTQGAAVRDREACHIWYDGRR